MQTTYGSVRSGAVPRLYRGGGDARHKGVSSVFDRLTAPRESLRLVMEKGNRP
jgi:hypothetical protein